MNISDVMIHINEPLSEDARISLENTLRNVEGVVSPKFGAGKEHLLLVAYDTETTNTTALLEKAQAAGYTAQLVGMQTQLLRQSLGLIKLSATRLLVYRRWPHAGCGAGLGGASPHEV